jgi:hypothetical protein
MNITPLPLNVTYEPNDTVSTRVYTGWTYDKISAVKNATGINVTAEVLDPNGTLMLTLYNLTQTDGWCSFSFLMPEITVCGTFKIVASGFENLSVNTTFLARPTPPPPPPVNHPPVVVLIAPINGTTVNSTSVNLTWLGTDADGDNITYNLTWWNRTIDIATRHIMSTNDTSYNLTNLEYNSTYFWVVTGSDGKALGNMTSIWRFDVSRKPEPVNHPPKITSFPPTNATIGVMYEYKVTALDSDGDTLTFALVTGIVGMTMNSSTGLLQWTPPLTHKGNVYVTVKVSDGRGGDDSQTYLLNVSAQSVIRPQCTITSPAANAIIKGKFNITGTSIRGTAVVIAVQYRLDGGDWKAAIGTNNWAASLDSRSIKNGKHRIEARAFDGSLNSDTVSVDFTVNNPEPTVSMENSPFCLIIVLICIVTGTVVFLWYRKKYY